MLVLLDTKFLDTNVPNGEDIKFLDTNIPNAEEKTAITPTNNKYQQKSIATKALFFFVLILTLNNLTFKLNTVYKLKVVHPWAPSTLHLI